MCVALPPSDPRVGGTRNRVESRVSAVFLRTAQSENALQTYLSKCVDWVTKKNPIRTFFLCGTAVSCWNLTEMNPSMCV